MGKSGNDFFQSLVKGLGEIKRRLQQPYGVELAKDPSQPNVVTGSLPISQLSVVLSYFVQAYLNAPSASSR